MRPSTPASGDRTTPVPNWLLDEALPILKDTELRVLLVVLRSTAGWVERGTGRAKRRDWIAGSQLRRRTGRSSEAVSGAIDALVRAEYLEVEGENGAPMRTAAERRRHIGKLYFQIVPPGAACGYVENLRRMPAGKTENNQALTNTKWRLSSADGLYQDHANAGLRKRGFGQASRLFANQQPACRTLKGSCEREDLDVGDDSSTPLDAKDFEPVRYPTALSDIGEAATKHVLAELQRRPSRPNAAAAAIASAIFRP